LSEDEWAIMRKHPDYARDFLARVDHLLPALDIPYCHHERWDGSGYPRGLKGEEIPIAARVFSVLDTFEALTSDRPYRRAWTCAEALEYIREQSGRQFDPAVVEAFLLEIPAIDP
jgi:HD-GYP domain-containing protein (c-di-GMP phosphodiesterase class II)